MSATLERGPAVTAAYAGRRRLPVAVPVAIALAWAAAAAAHATGVAGRFHHDALLGGGTPSLAGVFQFSSLKDRCLTECRHPAAYLLRHYRRGPRAAFRLGWGHGLYCLGCCWALMLVMFSVGVADLGWMAALAALVALHPSWMPPVMASLAGALGG